MVGVAIAVAVAEMLDPDCVEVLGVEEDVDKPETELELEPKLLVTSRPPQMLGELTAAPTEDFR